MGRTSDYVETFKVGDVVKSAFDIVQSFYLSKRIRVKNTEFVDSNPPTFLKFKGGKFFGGGINSQHTIHITLKAISVGTSITVHYIHKWMPYFYRYEQEWKSEVQLLKGDLQLL